MSREFELDNPVTAIAWSPNGHVIGTSEQGDTIVKIWDSETGQLLHTIHKSYQGSNRLLFSKNGQYLITSFAGSFDGKNRGALTIIDVSTGRIIRDVDGPHDPSNFVIANDPADFVLSPDGFLLYVRYNSDDQIRYYNTNNWNEVGSFKSAAFAMAGGPQPNQLTAVEIGPVTNIRPGPPSNGNPTVIADGHTYLEVWSTREGRFVNKFELKDPISPGSIAVDPTTCRAIIGEDFTSRDDKLPVGVWDLNSGTKLGAIPGVGSIVSVSLSPDGHLLAVAGGNQTVTLIDMDQPTTSFLLHTFNDYAWRVEFSPDGKRIMAAGDKKVIIYAVQ